MVRFIAIVMLVLIGVACQRPVCSGPKVIENVNLVRANFDAPAEVAVCKGGRQPQVVSLRVAGPGSLKVAESQLRYRGGINQSTCAASADVQELVPVALTSQSFAHYKLCYQDPSKTAILIVNLREACPAGTVEQRAPVDDCKQL